MWALDSFWHWFVWVTVKLPACLYFPQASQMGDALRGRSAALGTACGTWKCLSYGGCCLLPLPAALCGSPVFKSNTKPILPRGRQKAPAGIVLKENTFSPFSSSSISKCFFSQRVKGKLVFLQAGVTVTLMSCSSGTGPTPWVSAKLLWVRHSSTTKWWLCCPGTVLEITTKPLLFSLLGNRSWAFTH